MSTQFKLKIDIFTFQPHFFIDYNLIQIYYAVKGDHDERDYTGSGYVSGEDEEEGLPPPPHNGRRGGGQHGKCLT